MFLAMPFMDVVWDDDLLGGHEYQEQAESKTSAMTRICVNLDKHKMDGLSKLQVQELQVYLDNSEVFDECHNNVVWDSKMQSDMDTYESLLHGPESHYNILQLVAQHIECPTGEDSYSVAKPSTSIMVKLIEDDMLPVIDIFEL